jgi:hypothetical protein
VLKLFETSTRNLLTNEAARQTLPTHDEIAQLAFRLYEAPGRRDGHDGEDWQRAEEELERHCA